MSITSLLPCQLKGNRLFWEVETLARHVCLPMFLWPSKRTLKDNFFTSHPTHESYPRIKWTMGHFTRFVAVSALLSHTAYSKVFQWWDAVRIFTCLYRFAEKNIYKHIYIYRCKYINNIVLLYPPFAKLNTLQRLLGGSFGRQSSWGVHGPREIWWTVDIHFLLGVDPAQ